MKEQVLLAHGWHIRSLEPADVIDPAVTAAEPLTEWLAAA